MPHPRQPLRLCYPGVTTPRDPPAPVDAAFAAVSMKRPAPRWPPVGLLADVVGRRMLGGATTSPEPQWRKGAGRHVQCDITGRGDPSGNGHLEEHDRGGGLDAG